MSQRHRNAVDADPQQRETNSTTEMIHEWVARYHVALYRFAAGYTRDFGIAEDVVQEVFIRAWQVYKQRQQPLTAAWFYQVTHRLCVDQHRRSSRERKEREHMTTTLERPGETWQESILDRVAVRRVMKQLSRVDQICLWLFYYGDWTVRDIAVELGQTENAVKLRLLRARNRFRKLWEGGES